MAVKKGLARCSIDQPGFVKYFDSLVALSGWIYSVTWDHRLTFPFSGHRYAIPTATIVFPTNTPFQSEKRVLVCGIHLCDSSDRVAQAKR